MLYKGCVEGTTTAVLVLRNYLILNNLPYHPWDWHIYLHEWLVFMVFHAGKYTVRPMDPMGLVSCAALKLSLQSKHKRNNKNKDITHRIAGTKIDACKNVNIGILIIYIGQ